MDLILRASPSPLILTSSTKSDQSKARIIRLRASGASHFALEGVC